MSRLFLVAAAIAFPIAASAQHQPYHHHAPAAKTDGGHAHASPYSGFKNREIKALSETETADLASGRGMSMALPAEMNGYPGPMHALELADRLGLTSAQKAALDSQMQEMRREAVAMGAEVVEAERRLDRLFASGAATDETLKPAVEAAGAARAKLRLVHLRTHLATRATLTADQNAAYARLRGYAD
jgi:Spy/CpxP family protein refolding chaperone